LPRLAGQHGSPLLSLALESVAESGLWRRAAMMPHNDGDGKVRWTRGFSWPALFGFVHARVSEELRFRLWRCALQLCVTSPELAPFAEVPLALCDVVEDAPPGAAELLQAAIAGGADKDALVPLRQRLRQRCHEDCDALKLLMTQQDAECAEQARRAALAEVGIDVDAWAGVITLEAPREKLRSRRPAPVKDDKNSAAAAGSSKQGRRRVGAAATAAIEVAPSDPELPLLSDEALVKQPGSHSGVKGASQPSGPVDGVEPKRRKKSGKKVGEVAISSKGAPRAHGA